MCTVDSVTYSDANIHRLGHWFSLSPFSKILLKQMAMAINYARIKKFPLKSQVHLRGFIFGLDGKGKAF